MQQERKLSQSSIIECPKIPPLPDEIILIIFEYLTPEERIPLCTVCKRFRLLELQIGNRNFDHMFCLMLDDDEILKTNLCDVIVADINDDYCCSFETKPNGEFEAAMPAISKFFKGSTANYLNFKVSKNRYPNPSNGFFPILNLIAVKEVLLYLNCEAYSDFIIRFFQKFKSDNLRGVTFEWNSLKGQNVDRLQKAMQRLPKLRHVAVQTVKNNETVRPDDPVSFLVNGPLMLTMIRTAPRIHLNAIHCATQDLLNAFKIVCQLKTHKCLALFVISSATDNLLNLADEQGFLRRGCVVVDHTPGYGGYDMYVDHESELAAAGCKQVSIRRIDADGKADVYSDSDSDYG